MGKSRSDREIQTATGSQVVRDAGAAFPRIVIPYKAIKTAADVGEPLIKALNELIARMEKDGISTAELNARGPNRILRPEVKKYGIVWDKIGRVLFGVNSRGRPRTLTDRDRKIWSMRQRGETFGRIAFSLRAKTADVKAAFYRELNRREKSEARYAQIFVKIETQLRPFNIHFTKTP